MRWWALALLVGCRAPQQTEVRADPAPSVTVKPTPPPAPAPVNRVKGDIDGRFVGPTSAIVAEPIVIAMELTAKKPLTYFNGGDQRNAANYPMHFSVKATDASGAVVCDLVEKPALMSFGGLGSDMTVKAGDTYRESIVINPACPALATPGKYLVTIHRRFAASTLTFTKPGAKYPTSCDISPVHEALPAGTDPDCARLINGVPSLTTELPIEILPFDATKARAATAKTLKELGKNEIAHHRIERHLCGYVSCTCPKSPVSDADLVAAIADPLPKSFPGNCP
jgi:hypothetical protein